MESEGGIGLSVTAPIEAVTAARASPASGLHGRGLGAWAKLRVHGPKAHDGTITTEAPDVMWGTDMTATVTVGTCTAALACR